MATRRCRPFRISASGGWRLWEKLAEGRPEFGRPAVFNSHISESYWHSFTVTLKDTAFFDHMQRFSGNEAGTGGLVTLFESNWLMSIVLYHHPFSRASTVVWMLEEVGVPYELRFVDIMAGAQKSPELVALNPMGKLPVLTDGDVVP